MLKIIKLTIGFLFLALVVMGCRLAREPSANVNAPTNAQPTSSVPSQTSTTPCSTPSPDATRKVIITAPCDGAQVAHRSFVEGIASDSSARVWVIVHPMEAADYWVQPTVTLREGGAWKVLSHFGEPGQQHSGKRYELVAITNPKETLQAGQLLPNWPAAQSKSQVVEVVRE